MFQMIGTKPNPIQHPKPLQDFKEEDFSHIKLTPEETERAINHFRRLKSYDMAEQAKRDAKADEIAKLQQPWTYEELVADVLQRAKQLPFKFELDEFNKQVFHLLCLYFTNDAAFETLAKTDINPNPSLKKGICLVSPTKGTGKSLLMQLFARNKKRPFLCIPAKTIASEFMKRGEVAVEYYSQYLHVAPSAGLFYCRYPGICYEDLGHEQDKNNYGNKSNVMYDVLFKLNENLKDSMDFSGFHITSNNSGKDFELRYDERISSRMRQMFNIILLPGNDRRK